MGQELQVPSSFAGKGMASAFAQAGLNAQDDNLAEGIGQSYPVIAYKGKVWSIRHRGERKTVLRPDDGTPAAYLDVIILGQARTKSKSFYKKFDQGTSDGDRPICASMDGVTPDLDVQDKQSDTCALCPRNVWKTDATTGRKGRECTDYKRLAVLVMPSQSKPTLGSPLMEPCFLRVPPDSLNSLAIMGETMGPQGHHYSSYVTRITFDPAKAHPCMVFRPLQPLSEAEAPTILDLCKDPAVGRITGGDLAPGTMRVVNGPAATAQIAPTPPQQPAPVTPPPPAPSPAPAPSSSGLGLVPMSGEGQGQQAPPSSPNTGAALPVTPAPSISAEQGSTLAGLVSGASGGVNTVSDAPPPSSAPTGLSPQTAGVATVSDGGEPEESDAEMDAAIAALITQK